MRTCWCSTDAYRNRGSRGNWCARYTFRVELAAMERGSSRGSGHHESSTGEEKADTPPRFCCPRRDWFGSLPRSPNSQNNLPAATRKALNASVPVGGRAAFIPVHPSALLRTASAVSFCDWALLGVLCALARGIFRSEWGSAWAKAHPMAGRVCATAEKVKHPAGEKFFTPSGARTCAIPWRGPCTEFRHDSCNTEHR